MPSLTNKFSRLHHRLWTAAKRRWRRHRSKIKWIKHFAMRYNLFNVLLTFRKPNTHRHHSKRAPKNLLKHQQLAHNEQITVCVQCATQTQNTIQSISWLVFVVIAIHFYRVFVALFEVIELKLRLSLPKTQKKNQSTVRIDVETNSFCIWKHGQNMKIK